jgi:hypothetical protein
MTKSANQFGILVVFALLFTMSTALYAERNEAIVTRIEAIGLRKKGTTLEMKVVGFCRTPHMGRQRAWLRPHNGNRGPNKDGLLEYDMVYHPPGNYKGDKLKLARAYLKERSFPPDIKGVRIYAELNEQNQILASPSDRKKKKRSWNPFHRAKPENTPNLENTPKPESSPSN